MSVVKIAKLLMCGDSLIELRITARKTLHAIAFSRAIHGTMSRMRKTAETDIRAMMAAAILTPIEALKGKPPLEKSNLETVPLTSRTIGSHGEHLSPLEGAGRRVAVIWYGPSVHPRPTAKPFGAR